MVLRGTKYIYILFASNIFLPIPSLNKQKIQFCLQDFPETRLFHIMLARSCQTFLRHTSTCCLTCHHLESTIVSKLTVMISLIKVILLTTFEASINSQAPHALFLPSYKRKSLVQVLELFPHFSSSGGHE